MITCEDEMQTSGDPSKIMRIILQLIPTVHCVQVFFTHLLESAKFTKRKRNNKGQH